jgi:YD repeat-containing protein
VQKYRGPRYVVTTEERDNGLGGTHQFLHSYDSAWVDVAGRGWLSFNAHEVRDIRNTWPVPDLRHRTVFGQAWPRTGFVERYQLIKSYPATVIKDVDPVIGAYLYTPATTPARYFVRVEQTTTTDYETGGTYDGVPLRTIVEDPSYNVTYGYVATSTTTLTDPATGEVWTTTVDPNPTNVTGSWCLGLPSIVDTTKTLPGGAQAVRTLHYFWNSDCSLSELRDQSEASSADRLDTSFTYDGYGNPTVVSQDSVSGTAQDRSQTFTYDQWGQYPTAVTVGTVNLTTSMGWDYLSGQRASVTGPDALTTSWLYDAFGRVTKETRPAGHTDFSYAACGTCWPQHASYYVRATRSDGSDRYDYRDALNRPVGSSWRLPGGAQGRRETRYDSLGQVDRVSQPYVSTDPVFWVTNTDDLIGRVLTQDAPVSEAQTSGAATTYQYLGHTLVVTDANHHPTTYLHNAARQVKQVTDALSGVAGYTYTPFGELATMTDAESKTTTLGYNARGLKTSITDPNLGAWSYGYNVYNELTSQTNALNQTTTIGYDEAGRLATRGETEGTTTWSYYTSGPGSKGRVYTILARATARNPSD